MEIAVDGVVQTVAGEATLREILDRARFNIFKANRVITAIRLDGEELTREREKATAPTPASEYGRIEFTTACPYELSIATLKEIRPTLDNLERHHLDAARLITEGKGADALKILNGCFSAWDDILMCLKNISLIAKVDLTTIDAGGGRIAARISKLGEVLRNFKAAFAAQDIVRIRDIAQYELHPLIKEWGDVIDAVLEYLVKKSGNGGLRSG